MRFKKWGLFEEWKEVFGKDRATGETAEDVMDAVNEMLQDDHSNPHRSAPALHSEEIGTDANFDEEGEENSSTQSARTGGAAERRGRKRKSTDDPAAGIYEMLGRLCKNAEDRLEKLTKRIGYDLELGNAKKRVIDELSVLPNLSIDQRFDVCEILAEKTDRLEIFMCMPPLALEQYVARLLGTSRV